MNISFTRSSWAIYALLRFILSFIVLVAHLPWFTKLPSALQLINELDGQVAVIGFLLISGVSVGYSLKKQPVGYLERRFMRVYPLYFWGVIGAAVLMYMLPTPFELPYRTMVPSGFMTVLANLFFGQGFVAITVPYNGPLWTIAIEVALYTLAYIFFRARLEFVTLLVVLSMICFYFVDPKPSYGVRLFCYTWPWLIGFILSVKEKPTLSATLCLIGAPLVYSRYSRDGAGSLLLVTYITSCVVVFTAGWISVPEQSRKVFNYFGEISYPLYIFHVPLGFACFLLFGEQPAFYVIVFVLIGTVVMNQLFDHWLRRIFWLPALAFVKQKLQDRKFAKTPI